MPNKVSDKKVKMHLVRYLKPVPDGIDVGMTGKEDVVYVPEIYKHIVVEKNGRRYLIHDEGIVLSGTAEELGRRGKHESEFCDFCGNQFEKKNYRQRFCSHAHKTLAKRLPTA